MKTWWRILAGIGAGAGNLFANGSSPKQILFSVLVAAMGVISHFSSTSDPTQLDGTKPSVEANAAKVINN